MGEEDAASFGCPRAYTPPSKSNDGFFDPRNMMPVLPNRPLEDDDESDAAIVLSKDRQRSSIPKTTAKGTPEDTWVYPSPQQFYNALLRRNKNPEAKDAELMKRSYLHTM